MSRILVFGNSWLGGALIEALHQLGHDLELISDEHEDAAVRTAWRLGVPCYQAPDRAPIGAFKPALKPALILSAHSFRLLTPEVIAWTESGAIGYHPSLLPAFPGRRAVEDAVAAGVSVTGGTCYWMTPEIDRGPVVEIGGRRLQEPVAVAPGESAGSLWRRALGPLGLRMLVGAGNCPRHILCHSVEPPQK
ncbi:MAG: formyltransferase family protein [Roseicyclus sp.]|jgi:methionyl-tRNA formyltransferase|nr:formyltransferase family protein [Roseicyclus sp.]